MAPRTNPWTSSTFRVLMRRGGRSRKTAEEAPGREVRGKPGAWYITDPKGKCFQEMVFSAAESSNKM